MADENKAAVVIPTTPVNMEKVIILLGYQPAEEGAEFLWPGSVVDLPELEARRCIKLGIANFADG